jgi:hypothetical protein
MIMEIPPLGSYRRLRKIERTPPQQRPADTLPLAGADDKSIPEGASQ